MSSTIRPAAIRRGDAQIEITLPKLLEAERNLATHQLSPEESKEINRLRQLAIEKASDPPVLNALIRADRLDEIEAWIETKTDKEDAYEITSYLVDMDTDTQQLESLANVFTSSHISAVLDFYSSTYAVYSVVAEMDQGAKRIADIVKSLKSYSYLDQAPVQLVDVHNGIEDTLIIFGSRLRKGISVVKEYGEKLPPIDSPWRRT